MNPRRNICGSLLKVLLRLKKKSDGISEATRGGFPKSISREISGTFRGISGGLSEENFQIVLKIP